jgi:transglutaminase-like putative cysteine protease
VNPFLRSSTIVDFNSPCVAALATTLKNAGPEPDYADRCFVWVRDNISHSADVDSDVVACSASEVLQARVGLCYAKSHLLVALLRANGVRAGFVYQRLSLATSGYCLHGLVSVEVPAFGWYRVDPRGGERGAMARFSPPEEKLVYNAEDSGEFNWPDVHAEPLEVVVAALRYHRSMKELLTTLPDVPPRQ